MESIRTGHSSKLVDFDRPLLSFERLSTVHDIGMSGCRPHAVVSKSGNQDIVADTEYIFQGWSQDRALPSSNWLEVNTTLTVSQAA